MTSANESPIALAILLCDQVIRDLERKKASIIGVFSAIYTKGVPCYHQTFAIYLRLTNGRGHQKIELKMKHQESGDTAGTAVNEIEMDNPDQIVEVVFEFRDLTFEDFGRYIIEFSANGEYVSECRFDLNVTPS